MYVRFPTNFYFVGEGHCDRSFQTVQRNVSQERADNAALRGSPLRWKEFPLIHNSCLEPGLDGLAHCFERVQFGQECIVVDAIKALRNIGVQHIFSSDLRSQ